MDGLPARFDVLGEQLVRLWVLTAPTSQKLNQAFARFVRCRDGNNPHDGPSLRTTR